MDKKIKLMRECIGAMRIDHRDAIMLDKYLDSIQAAHDAEVGELVGAAHSVIAEFERLQNECTTLRDRVYLDGVLAVLDSHLVPALTNYHKIDCPECDGWKKTTSCPECGNIGTIYHDSMGEGYRVCSNAECKQEYYTNVNYCPACKGSGKVWRRKG